MGRCRDAHAHEPCAWPVRIASARTSLGAPTTTATNSGGEDTVWRLIGPPALKRPTNLSVRGDLVDAARAARLNLSALLERAVEEQLVRIRWRQWREANA